MLPLAAKFTELSQQSPARVIMQVKTAAGYESFTYQDIYQQAEALAQKLQQHYQIKPTDRVALILENGPQWAVVYFGIMLAGAIAVPIDPQVTVKERDYFLEHSESKLLIEEHEKVLKFTQISTLHSEENSVDDLSHVASILYTSGTTGLPKGVLLTHENFLANYEGVVKLGLIDEHHNVLSLLPLHHSLPFMVNLLVPLFSGAMITYVTDLSSETILAAMRETGVTAFIGVPQLFYLLYNNILAKLNKIPWLLRMPLFGAIELGSILHVNKFLLAKVHHMFGKKLRFFVSGGAKLDAKVSKFFTKLGFKFLEGYGLSETAPVVTFNNYNHPKAGSVGQAIPGVKIKLAAAKAGIGEVLVSGANVMPGYYKNPKASADVLKKGWFYTGDLGRIDAAGCLYIVGRKKELIVLSSGKNIAPDQVEEHYLKSPFIEELCVLAVGKRGEDSLQAVIVPDMREFRKASEVSIVETIKWQLDELSKHYPTYKRIMGFVIATESLPKTRLGKLKRFAIKEQYQAELLGHEKVAAEPAADLSVAEEKFLKVMQSYLPVRAINMNSHLELDLGLDSLTRIELFSNLSREFKVVIADTVMGQVFTVRELYSLMTKHENNSSKEQVNSASWAEIIAAEPPAKIKEQIEIAPGPFKTAVSLGLNYLVAGLMKLCWRVKAEGIENLPQDKPFILCPNHSSYLDGLVMGAAAPKWLRKKMFSLAYSSYFTAPVIKHLVKVLKVVPIDAVQHLVGAMQASAYVLKQEQVLTIFPAGARSIDGKVQKFKKGVGILAKELNVTIVPAYISGSYEAWPRGKKLPRFRKITVTFGKPFNVSDLKKASYEDVTLAIREKVLQLQKS